MGKRTKKSATKAGLRREVNRKPPRGNKFWFKLAAFSFTVKVALVVALFFVMRAVMT